MFNERGKKPSDKESVQTALLHDRSSRDREITREIELEIKKIELEEKDLTNYHLHIVRFNLRELDLTPYEAKGDEQVALVGTSSIRSILYACELTNKSQKEIIPRLFIIDNSKNVYNFWKELKEFVNEPTKGGDEESFLKNLSSFIGKFDQPDENKDRVLEFFTSLFNKYGFEFVKEIILNTIFIKQNWQDTNTFSTLKNILDNLKIINIAIYPSNIVSYVNDKTDDARTGRVILNNIVLLKPKLSIHTNLTDGHIATEVFVSTDQSPQSIEQQLYKEISDPYSRHLPEQERMNDDPIDFWLRARDYNHKWSRATEELDRVYNKPPAVFFHDQVTSSSSKSRKTRYYATSVTTFKLPNILGEIKALLKRSPAALQSAMIQDDFIKFTWSAFSTVDKERICILLSKFARSCKGSSISSNHPSYDQLTIGINKQNKKFDEFRNFCIALQKKSLQKTTTLALKNIS